ncbi:MAG: hypothetical protein R2784_18200 [Saprospiraceae bacterium]
MEPTNIPGIVGCLSMREQLGDLGGKKVAIFGDITVQGGIEQYFLPAKTRCGGYCLWSPTLIQIY